MSIENIGNVYSNGNMEEKIKEMTKDFMRTLNFSSPDDEHEHSKYPYSELS